MLAQFSSFLFWRISSEKLHAAIMISEVSLHTKISEQYLSRMQFDDKAWRGRVGTARIEREDSATDAPNLAIGKCSGRSHRKPT